MNKEKLNSLVIAYRRGNHEVLDEIFQTINPLIERASKEIEGKVADVTKFDCRLIIKAKKIVEETFDEKKGDFISVFKTAVSREKEDFVNRRSKYLDEVSMEFLAEPQGDELGYQFEDRRASVEDDIAYKEKVTLLAQGDERKEIILDQWTKGATDKSISEMLAHRFGGNEETHRRFITRFRPKCQNILLSQGLI